jgi:hypothetical protein
MRSSFITVPPRAAFALARARLSLDATVPYGMPSASETSWVRQFAQRAEQQDVPPVPGGRPRRLRRARPHPLGADPTATYYRYCRILRNLGQEEYKGNFRQRRTHQSARRAGCEGRTTLHTYGTNGIPIPPSRPWLVNSGLDASAILRAAARAKVDGAAIVIVSLHWGKEYQHAPTDEQRTLARRLLASPDVDLILGDHVHVVQPFEQINGKWVVYGMGNQIANPIANSEDTHEGLVARFRLTCDAAGHWRAAPSFVPTLVEAGPPIRLVDLPQALARADLPAGTRARYRAALNRTTAAVHSLGSKVPVLDGPLPGTPASAEQLAGP